MHWRNREQILHKKIPVYQHEYDTKTQKKNGIGDHMRISKHKINWSNKTFLEIEKDWGHVQRRIKEALYINSINPLSEIDPTKLMNPGKGTEIAACWKEFHPEIRSTLKKATAKDMPKKISRKTSRKITRNKIK